MMIRLPAFRLLTWAAVGVVSLSASSLFAAEHKLTADNTSIKYVGAKPSGDSHTGSFKKLEGKLDLPDDVTKLKLEVVIDVESIDSDNARLTAHLKTPDFFDARQFPQAKFVSKEVKVEGDKTTVHGELTMHGKTEALSFPIKIERGENPKLTAEFNLPRKKWGITYGEGQINEDVKITVVFDAAKKPAPAAAPAAKPAAN